MNEDPFGNMVFLEGSEVNQVICWTKRDIRKGEELFVYYGGEVDREHWGQAENSSEQVVCEGDSEEEEIEFSDEIDVTGDEETIDKCVNSAGKKRKAVSNGKQTMKKKTKRTAKSRKKTELRVIEAEFGSEEETDDESMDIDMDNTSPKTKKVTKKR